MNSKRVSANEVIEYLGGLTAKAAFAGTIPSRALVAGGIGAGIGGIGGALLPTSEPDENGEGGSSRTRHALIGALLGGGIGSGASMTKDYMDLKTNLAANAAWNEAQTAKAFARKKLLEIFKMQPPSAKGNPPGIFFRDSTGKALHDKPYVDPGPYTPKPFQGGGDIETTPEMPKQNGPTNIIDASKGGYWRPL